MVRTTKTQLKQQAQQIDEIVGRNESGAPLYRWPNSDETYGYLLIAARDTGAELWEGTFDDWEAAGGDAKYEELNAANPGGIVSHISGGTLEGKEWC